MRVLEVLAVTAALIAASDFADAKTVSKTAASGKTVLMYTYANWTPDCSSYGGVVNLVTRPQHGRVSPRKGIVPTPPDRLFGITKCYGKPIMGFHVYYTSAPGFRGTDSFTIEVKYEQYPTQVDTFTITVQ
jgi:hypothetical protein